jgi:hypothetical protein
MLGGGPSSDEDGGVLNKGIAIGAALKKFNIWYLSPTAPLPLLMTGPKMTMVLVMVTPSSAHKLAPSGKPA